MSNSNTTIYGWMQRMIGSASPECLSQPGYDRLLLWPHCDGQQRYLIHSSSSQTCSSQEEQTKLYSAQDTSDQVV